MRQHTDDEKAFYADDAWDIEFKLNTFGWYEVVGVHDRTDYDLKQHAEFSKVKLDAEKYNVLNFISFNNLPYPNAGIEYPDSFKLS